MTAAECLWNAIVIMPFACRFAMDLQPVIFLATLKMEFHPKGEMAKKYGVFLEDKGITDRATVIIDKQGIVRYAKSVTPAGERNPKELLAEAQKVNQSSKS